eukprot:GFUD01028373.1.p1 GENE.GFUD01028373.1~~GFUD01028373.1.p1  ORF type:complete len:281 (-),score=36.96 GFUD01028373.1:43-768(-)
MAGTVPLDLFLASLELRSDVFEVETLDTMDNMDYIVFPSIDLLPEKKRDDFGKKMRNLFRSSEFSSVEFKKEVSVIFGGNIAGLICAKEFGDVFPFLRKNIYIPSSIYYASKQAFVKSGNRTFPMINKHGCTKFYYAPQEETGIMRRLKGLWYPEAFNNLEATVLLEMLVCIKEMDGDISGLEMVGRFPSEEESDDFQISRDIPVWLPAGASVGPQFTDHIKNQIKLTSEWMFDGYKQVNL